MLFKELKLKKWIVQTLDQISIKEPTEIQREALPLALSGKNVIGEIISKCDDWKW